MAITYTRRQSAAATGNPASATFGSTPVEGNLLMAFAWHRADSTLTSPTISGSGWTERERVHVLPSASQRRRAFLIWTKIAGASEPTNVQADLDSQTTTLMIQEFAAGEAVDWTFRAIARADDGDSGTTNLTTPRTQNTGTTASIAAGDILEIALCGCRGGNVNITAVSDYSTPTIGNIVSTQLSTAFARLTWCGFRQSSAAGTRVATANWNDGSNQGRSAWMMVWTATAVVGGTTYEGAITLAGQAGITAAAGLLFADAVTMAASGGVTSAVDAVLRASLALEARGSLTASAVATMGGSISVGAGAGVAPGNTASMTVAALLASAAGMTSTGGFIVSGELELGAAAGDTATATLLFAEAIELGSSAAASVAGRLDAAGAFTLTADGGVAADGRQDMAAAFALGAVADMAVTADATALFQETITLGAAATVAVEARGLFGATVTFSAEMDMAAAASMTMAEALELAAGAVVNMLATMPGDVPTARRTIALTGTMIAGRALQGSMTITVTLPGETATPRHLIGRIT